MENESIKKILAELLAVTFGNEEIEAFCIYINEVISWSKRSNLVSSGDLCRLVDRHLADSLVLLPYLKNSNFIVDVGSGAGFPGLPISIVMKSTTITLIEPKKKKTEFLRHIKRILRLQNLDIVEDRVEELSDIVSKADSILFRGVGGLESIFLSIKSYLKEDARLFVLTSKNKVAPIKGFKCETIPYKFKKGDWGGVIGIYSVSRETRES